MRFIAIILVAAVGVVPAAQAQFFARFTNPQVEVTMTHPPGFPLTLQRAAVIARGDECAEEFADTVIERFTGKGVELLDRQNIEAVLAEQDFGSSGYVDTDSAVELGKVLGSAALILVNTQRCDEERNRTREKFKTLDGKQGVKYTAKTEGFFKASVRVVDLATARIFAAKTVEGRSKLENTSYDGYPEYPSAYDARDAAQQQAIGQVHRMFFSWDERRNLYFFNDDDCNLRAAFKLLKIDDIRGAASVSEENVELCKTADVKPKFLARAYYNLGMTHLLQSEYEDALDYLQQAYRMDGGSIIAESISEARRAQELATSMAELEDSAAVGAAPSHMDRTVQVARTDPRPTADAGQDSLADRLKKLDGLLEQGLISDEEYETKRAELLSEI